MSKLFSHEDLDTEQVAENLIEAKIENSDIPDMTEVHETSIQVSVEGVLKAASDLYIVKDVQASLESKKLSSVEYFTSIENYSLFMKSVSNNLGISTKIPSMEDFKNPYGIKASHQFVMEGFTDFVRSIWEKIKSFFKDFFKKIMLFMKRLVNANLEMEEYEEYIESLMRNVKKSDKKNVEPIIVDSKLPSMLSDFGMEELTTDYLFTKGSDKLMNLSRVINVLSDHQLTKFEKDLGLMVMYITTELESLKQKDISSLSEIISNIRNRCSDDFSDTLFTTEVPFKVLPDEVQSTVLNNFDTEQLRSGNARFYSLVNDRDSSQSLPKHYNVYLVVSSYDTANDSSNVRTSKMLVVSNTEKNTHIHNNMKTIADRDNLIKFYEFYKKFSKEFKIKSINDKLISVDKNIEKMVKDIAKPFEHVLARESIIGPDTEFGREWGATVGVARNAAGEPIQQPMLDDISTQSSISSSNTSSDPQSRKEFEYLHKFMLNYMNCTQSYLKEFSVNIAASGQECRYEMIKLLYKSAKQF